MRNVYLGKVLIATILFTAIISCSAPLSSLDKLSNSDSIYWRSYNFGRQSGDLKNSSTILLLMLPSAKDSNRIKDSLASHYFNLREFDQCIYWSRSCIRSNDSNVFALLLLGNAYKMKGDFLKAIDAYENLLRMDKKPEYFLFLAESQFRVKRLLECVQTTLSELAFIPSSKFSYTYLDSNNIKRSTNVYSAILNIRGLAYFDLNDLDSAEQAFVKAIQFDSEFSLAKFNLMIVRQKRKH